MQKSPSHSTPNAAVTIGTERRPKASSKQSPPAVSTPCGSARSFFCGTLCGTAACPGARTG